MKIKEKDKHLLPFRGSEHVECLMFISCRINNSITFPPFQLKWMCEMSYVHSHSECVFHTGAEATVNSAGSPSPWFMLRFYLPKIPLRPICRRRDCNVIALQEQGDYNLTSVLSALISHAKDIFPTIPVLLRTWLVFHPKESFKVLQNTFSAREDFSSLAI